jgi:2,4-dienoyl-CoA reductase-like NADH-dependent reductase (Old Yellow Enzyme family)/thioredoxin reductase
MAKASDPINIGPVRVENRLVGAPLLTNGAYWDEHGPGQAVVDLYRERAEGGAGLVHVEAVGITARRGKSLGAPEQIEGFARLSEAIHDAGAKATVQLIHAGRQFFTDTWGRPPPGAATVSVSDETPAWAGVQPRGLTVQEIEQIHASFARAAANAKQAGFDGVMFHGTHGFLIQQFMSPYTNVGRRDRYGTDRSAFAVDLIQRTREAVGPDFALIMRINGHEGVEGGLTAEIIAEEIAPRLEEAGIDAIEVTAANFEKFYFVGPPIYFPRGIYIPWAETIQKSVKIPVIGVGRLNHPHLIEKILAEERVAMVALGRTLLADPDFPRKMLEGRWDEIRHCTACGECGGSLAPPGAAMGCAINPYLGRPAVRSKLEMPAPDRKKVMVIGGGIGGMTAAEVAASRGHDVTLYEKASRLGGMLNVASSIPRVYTRELRNFVWDGTHRLEQVGVKLRLESEVTPDIIAEMEPDVVVLAVGSEPVKPEVPGIEKPFVVTQEQCINNEVELGQRVAVFGGQEGAEIALGLAREGRFVTLLSETDETEVARAPWHAGTWRWQLLLEMMHDEEHLRIRTGIKLKKVIDGAIVISFRNGTWEETLKVDNLVLALGRRSADSLKDSLSELVEEVYEVGDCVQPRSVFHAVHEATETALKIGEADGSHPANLFAVPAAASDAGDGPA